MPLLYGEGKKAITRLQQMIVSSTEDHSIFARRFSSAVRSFESFWNDVKQGSYIQRDRYKSQNRPEVQSRFSVERPLLKGCLAESPKDFPFSGNVRFVESSSIKNPSNAIIRRDSI
jgi:hypothetical protein